MNLRIAMLIKIIDSGTYSNSSLTEYTMSATGKEYYTFVNQADEDGKVTDLSGEAVRLEGTEILYCFQVPDQMYDNRLIEQFCVKIKYDNVDFADVDGGSENGPPEFYCYNLGRRVYNKWGEMQVTGDNNYLTVEKTSIDVYPSMDYYIDSYTKQIWIKVHAPDGDGVASSDDDAEIDIDTVSVIFNVKRLEITTPETSFNFGNIYINSNASTRIYNESRKKTFQFKNIGNENHSLNWEISSDQDWIRFSKSEGCLYGQHNDMVEVWLQPLGSPGTYTGTITFSSDSQDIDIPVSANAWRPTQIIYGSPTKGANNKVNVIINNGLTLQISSQGPSNPDAAFGEYLWKKVSGTLSSTTLDNLTSTDFEKTSVPEKNYPSLSPVVGDYTVYCETYETINGYQVESDPLTIPVRVCKRTILQVEYPDGTKPATWTTTDNTLNLCLRGYDTDNNILILLENVAGTWTVSGGIGSYSSTCGTATIFDPKIVGMGTITATDGTLTGTTVLTVVQGVLHHIRIEHFNGTMVGATQTTTDGALNLYLRGYDADNNRIENISGTWTVEGGIGTCTPGYGSSTLFNPIRPGVGTITVTSGSYTATVCPITVGPGALERIRIEYSNGAEIGTIGITTDDSLRLYLRGYDADNNLLGNIVGRWIIEGGIENCIPIQGTTTLFDPTRPGAGTITVTDNIHTDTTGMITVKVGGLHHIRIEYPEGAEAGMIDTTTDNSLKLYLRGYDAENNLIGDVIGKWTIEGSSTSGGGIGSCSSEYDSSTIFNPTKPGIGTIIVTNNIQMDTTGTITVSLGVLDHIRIEYLDFTEVSAPQTTTDAAITLCLRGYDADNNLIGDIAGTWTVGGGIGNCVSEYGSSAIFDPTRPGAGTITAAYGTYTDTTGMATVKVGALHRVRIEHLDGVEIGANQTTTYDSLNLYLRGYDADNNLIGDIIGKWTVSGGIGICTPEYGTKTCFNPTTPGAGTITATDNIHTDTTGLFLISLGSLDHIRIEYLDFTEAGATQTTTDNPLNLYLRGYDADDNLIGNVIGEWLIEGGIGTCSSGYGSSTIFDPTRPGAGTITVIDGVHRDTMGIITVKPGALHHIRIEDSAGTEAEATQTTTDDTLNLYLRGYDADNNLLGDVVGTWTVGGGSTSGGGVGNCASGYGNSTIFNPTRPGAGTITATDGVYTDTICPITVSLGELDHIRIEHLAGTEAGATQTTTDDTLTLCLRGYDADNNLIGDIAGTWTVEGGIGNCASGYDNSTIFNPTRPGAGTITATTGVHTDTTGIITVSLGMRDHIRIEYSAGTEVMATQITTDGSLSLYLRGYDADNNLLGDIVGTWTIDGGIGNCTPGYGSSTLFDPTTPGAGTITITDGDHTDTICPITVSIGTFDHIHIEYFNGTEVPAIQITTDNPLNLYLRGYDADHNLIGDIIGKWTVVGGIGNCMPGYGLSTLFDPIRPGTGTVMATDGTHTDTTSITTVGLGVLHHICIENFDGMEIEATRIITDNTMNLYLRGYDADNNLLGDIIGTWTVEGGIGICTPEYGISTLFDPTWPGAGTITATDGIHTDTTSITAVKVGARHHICIEYLDGAKAATRITTDDTRNLYLRGYDADNNLIGDVVGTWTVSGGIGSYSSGYGSSIIFDPTRPGAGTITVTDGIHTDTTGLITVSLGIRDHIRIEYSAGIEVMAAQTTTDGSLNLYLRGYDADNNLIGDVAGTWTVGGGIGNCVSAYGSSTIFDPTRPGAGNITVTDGVHTDTTDVFSISLGDLYCIRIEYPDGTGVGMIQTTTDAAFSFCLRGYDADSNLLGDIIGNWTVEGGIGSYTPGYGISIVFDPTRPGAGTITVTDGIHTDTTGLITVSLGALNHICIEHLDGTGVGATQTTTDNALSLYLRGYDADNNLLGNIAGTWTVTGGSTSGRGMGNCSPGYGTSTIFDLTRPGAGTITATDGVHIDNIGAITVDHGQPAGLKITPGTITLTADDSRKYIATAMDADGNSWDVTGEVTWSEDDPIGTMAGSIYYAGKAGTHMITGTLTGAIAATASVKVTHGAFVNLSLTAPATTTTFAAFTMTVSLHDNDGNPYSGTVAVTNINKSIIPDTVNLSSGIWTGTAAITSSPNKGKDVITVTNNMVKTTATITVFISSQKGGMATGLESGTAVDFLGTVATDIIVHIATTTLLPKELPGVIKSPGIAYAIEIIDEQGNSVETTLKKIGSCTVQLPYSDTDNDGMVDGTNIREQDLVIYLLEGELWLPLETTIDVTKNVARAYAPHFSIFTLGGIPTITTKNNLMAVIVYPNPCKPHLPGHDGITFDNLTSECTVRIYNIAGDLVYEKEVAKSQGKVIWDLRDDSEVSSGVYFYVITNPAGERVIDKLAIIW
ncbi:MAG: T9SS type A sorting domain-containing protein [Nitrospirae bacterium]|nr:T9SS type A sorting domain-containing protein [Nitrospirota bacterium]